MNYFERIYGNETVRQMWQNEVHAGTLAHAFIVEGAVGSGRRTLARAALCALAGEPMAQRIARGVCPDIITVRVPDGKSMIVVDQIRAVREEAYLRPSELDFKAFLIEDAHRMNEAAQNALLKVLEEPPDRVYFFLICDTGCRLLPTVCSRAQTVRTQRFSEQELGQILCELSEHAARLQRERPEEFVYLLRSSAGSIGMALSALERGGDAQGDVSYQTVIAMLDALRGSDKGTLLLLEGRLSDEREEFLQFLFELANALRDILAIKRTSEQMLFFYSAQQAQEYAFSFSERALLKKIRLCLQLAQQAEANVNLKIAKVRLLDGLWG